MQRSTTQCQRKAQRNVNAMSRQWNSSACDKTVHRGPCTVNVLHRVQWIAATEQLDEHAASGCSVRIRKPLAARAGVPWRRVSFPLAYVSVFAVSVYMSHDLS